MPNEIYHRSNWGNANAEGFGDVYFDAAATNKLYNHSDYYENSDGTDKILRDLSNKASIVLTPTAYSDGSLNTVIPPYQVLPEELVTNGTFDTDSDWVKGGGWTISNGTANANNAELTYLYQTISNLAVGKKYSITYTITSYTSGNVVTGIGNFLGNRGTTRNSVGTYTDIITFSINTTFNYFGFLASDNFTGSIDNVSVKEIQEADFDFSRGSSATRVNEQGLIESEASNLPRIDYTSGFGSLLLEPQRSNLVTYSEDFSQGWSLGANATLTYVSDVVAPDGTSGVYRLQLPATNDTYILSNTFASSNPLSTSIYVKSSGQGKDDFNLYTGGSFVSDKFTATSEWQRFEYTAQGSSFYIINSGDTFASDIYIWGAQAEAGSYPTSYIPTSGSSVTRSADVANNSGNADLFNDSEGVLYAEIAALANDGTNRRLSISDGTSSNSVFIGYTTNSNIIRFAVIDGGSTQGNIEIAVNNISNHYKVAGKYKANDVALWVNGFELGTDTSATMASGITSMQFDSGSGSLDFYGKTKELAVFKEALTDAELENLTSWVSFTEMATDLEYTLE